MIKEKYDKDFQCLKNFLFYMKEKYPLVVMFTIGDKEFSYEDVYNLIFY